MAIKYLDSVKEIERLYPTGENPVLVICSDLNAYICKYMRSSLAAFKLACELIGSQMAIAWQLETPDVAFVKIKSSHWAGYALQHSISAPALGCKKIDGVVDINSSTFKDVKPSTTIFRQLLKIALFDFWIANEDRNCNNANLLYDVGRARLVSIDYGCILNTATFDYPMAQLTSNESILSSDLFQHLYENKDKVVVEGVISELEANYESCLNRSRRRIIQILEDIPKEWNVPNQIIENKLMQLFDNRWIIGVWKNFVESINDIIN